jgi:hypothetical protein
MYGISRSILAGLVVMLGVGDSVGIVFLFVLITLFGKSD